MAATAVIEKQALQDLLLILDLGGTFVFAISGAMVGVRQRLDIFGVLVLSFAASSAGGIARDLLIGAVPPAAVSDWRYVAVAMLAGVLAFLWSSPVVKLRTQILLFDAIGLAFFAVAGAEKALAYHLNPLMAALLGMLTGIGGGMTRDLLVAQTPSVLKGDLYAVAALAAAALVVVGNLLGWPVVPAAAGAGLLCLGIRLLAILRGWGLPVAGQASERSSPPLQVVRPSGQRPSPRDPDSE
ncbi:MAG: trimeric intracellular cation channel family protein [Sphingomicrobium sp.]